MEALSSRINTLFRLPAGVGVGRFLGMMNTQPILCYVDRSFAYFTTQPLDKQWGDDWDDAPYEHNAGPPYTYQDYNKERGDAPWEITLVAFTGDFEAAHIIGDVSVEKINRGFIPWLNGQDRDNPKKPIIISAGVTIPEFCRLIKQGGGDVYLKQL